MSMSLFSGLPREIDLQGLDIGKTNLSSTYYKKISQIFISLWACKLILNCVIQFVSPLCFLICFPCAITCPFEFKQRKAWLPWWSSICCWKLVHYIWFFSSWNCFVFVFSSKIWFRAARAIVIWQEHLLMHFLGFWVTLSHLGGDILRQLIFLNPIAMILYEKLTSLQYVKQSMRDTLLEDVVDSMNCHQCALFVVWP